MCELLGIDQSVLERAFSFRTVEAKMEKVSTTLNVAQVGLPPLSYHTLSYPHCCLLALVWHFLYPSLIGVNSYIGTTVVESF